MVQKAENKYKAIFQSIDEGFSLLELIFDNNGKVVDYWHKESNPAFVKITGLKNPFNKRASDFLPGLEQEWFEALGKAYYSGEPIRVEHPVKELQRWYSCHLARVGSEGNFFIAAVYDDITERKRIEKDQSFLSAISKQLVELQYIGDTMQELGEKIARHFNAPWCYLAEQGEDAATVVSSYGWNAADVPSLKGTYRLKDLWPNELTETANEAVVTIVNDTQTDERLATGLYSLIGIRSFVAMPIGSDGRLHFTLTILDTRPRQWRDDEIELMQELVSRIWARLERARAEEALQQSQEKYRTVFDNMEQGFCIIDVLFDEAGKAFDYRFLEVNPVFEKQTGLQNAVGKRIKELEPAQEDHWFQIYGDVVKTGKLAHFENEAAHLAGGVWYDVFALPVDTPTGRQVAVFFNDTTERKKAEERQAFLLKLNDALRPLVDPAAIQSVAAELLGKHLKANQSQYGEVLGDYMHIRHGYGDGIAPMTGWYRLIDFGERMMESFRSGRVQICNDATTDPTISDAEHTLLAAAQIGSYIAMPLVKENQWMATLSVHSKEPRQWKQHEIDLVQDVAERTWAAVEKAKAESSLRKSEEKYRTLFNSIDEGFCIIEMIHNTRDEAINYRFVEVNKAYEKHTGQKNPTGRLGNFVAPDTEPYWLSIYDNVARTGQPIRFENYHQDSQRWYESYASRLGGEGSRQVAIIFNDVTERRQREEQQDYLLKLNDALLLLTDPLAIQETAARILGQHLHASRTFYYEAIDNGDGYTLTIKKDYHSDDMPDLAGRYQQKAFGKRLFKNLPLGEPLAINDVNLVPMLTSTEIQAYHAAKVQSFIAVPFLKADKYVAGINVQSSVPRAWTTAEIELAKETAERTWTAVEQAKAKEQLAKELEHTKKLQEISNQIIVENNIDALYAALLDSAMDIMHSDAASMQTLSRDNNDLLLLSYKNFHPQSAKTWAVLHADSTTSCGQALLKNERIVFPNVDEAPLEISEKDLEAYRLSNIVAMQSTPLISRSGKPLGMISTHWNKVHHPSDHDLNLLDVLARQAADLIEQREAQEALRESKERMSKLVTLMPAAVYTCDAQGHITYYNRRAVEMWGREPNAEEISGKYCGSLRMWLPDGSLLMHEDSPMANAVLNGRSTRNMEVVIERPDGSRILANANIDPLYDNEGRPAGAINVFMDITEGKLRNS